MRRLLTALAAAVAATTALTPAAVAAAPADVLCSQALNFCLVTASSPARPAAPPESRSVDLSAQSSSVPGCHTSTGIPLPCSSPVFGWLNATDGCYYRAAPAPPAGSMLPGQLGASPTSPGGYYTKSCPSEVGGRFGTVAYTSALVWRAAPPAGSPRLPSPAQLAQLAVSRLALAGPAVSLAPPPGRVLVGVPVWIWTSPAGWSGRSATAAVPGESVTATARPVSTVYTLGDGGQVVCTGPGTRWSAQAAQVSPGYRSPTCGYTYRRSSTRAPGGVFVLSGTTSWQVSWAGGGQSGALNMTTRSAPVRVRVADAEALNTTGSSR